MGCCLVGRKELNTTEAASLHARVPSTMHNKAVLFTALSSSVSREWYIVPFTKVFNLNKLRTLPL